MMTRIAQHTAKTITHTFDATTVANVVLRVVRDDGSELVPSTSVTPPASGTTYSYQLTAAHTVTLDTLTATWTATLDGQTQSFTDIIEIAGGFLFEVADAQAIQLGSGRTLGAQFSRADIEKTRVAVEDTIEDAIGYPLVPRYGRVQFSGIASSELLLPPYTSAVRWVTVGGTTVNATTTLSYSGGLILNNPQRWAYGIQNIEAGVEHGMAYPPARLRSAGLLLAKVWLVSGPVDDRVTTMSSPDTGITATLAIPGRAGSVVGVPEVDAAIQRYRLPSIA